MNHRRTSSCGCLSTAFQPHRTTLPFVGLERGTPYVATVTGDPTAHNVKAMPLSDERVVAVKAAGWRAAEIISHDISRESINSPVGAGFGVSLMCGACIGASYAGVVHREARDGYDSWPDQPCRILERDPS